MRKGTTKEHAAISLLNWIINLWKSLNVATFLKEHKEKKCKPSPPVGKAAQFS